MSPQLQEWLALALVVAVLIIALWRREKNKHKGGCNDCAASQCQPPGKNFRPNQGKRRDPYRPELFRPID